MSSRNFRFARGAAPGFTLIEVLITIALMGLLATVLISGAGRLFSDQPESPEEILTKVVEDARQFAVINDTEVRLSFDAKEKAFTMSSEKGEQKIPVTGAPDLVIEFLSTDKNGAATLIGGELVETQTTPYARFFNDGTSAPFKVQIRIGGNVARREYDPWTCSPVLESKPL